MLIDSAGGEPASGGHVVASTSSEHHERVVPHTSGTLA